MICKKVYVGGTFDEGYYAEQNEWDDRQSFVGVFTKRGLEPGAFLALFRNQTDAKAFAAIKAIK